ncbi:hypothetical protein [Halothermothrix orenii]|uniref:Uncharacterized protein n=1 Tax=Halothermothrix orenii (strain H 168 / OCM 544 / DSM 9562) TaxID=373903 RepID=B8CW00_HALOH|nr:hypothetical protein [Halothermothrix orenii]ACL69469.1 hypothetical protein Hore_07120 [Halothermothrix orenii H 168]
MKRRTALTLMVAVSLLLIITVSIQAGGKSGQVVRVTSTVKAYQELTEIRPVSVNLEQVKAQLKNGNPVIINNVGQTRITSNVNWNLNLSIVEKSGYDVYVKPSGISSFSSQWIKVNSNDNLLKGHRGSYLVSWDVMIVPVANHYPHTNQLLLQISLSPVTT